MANKVTERRKRGDGAIYERDVVRKKKRADGTPFETVTHYFVAEIGSGHDVVTGRPLRKQFYCKNRFEAEAKIHGQGAAPPAPSTRREVAGQKQLLSDYLTDWAETAGSAESSRRLYRNTVKHIVPLVGSVRLGDFSRNHVKRLYADVKRLNADKPALQRRVHDVLSNAMNAAVESGSILASPVHKSDAPKYKTAPVSSITLDQAKAFLAAVSGDRLEALYILAVSCGLRQGELLALKWIDIDGKRLRIARNLREVDGTLTISEPKTKAGNRTITLTARAIEALDARRSAAALEGHGSPYIFTDQAGRLFLKSKLMRSYRPMLKKAELPPMTFHALRHAAASLHLLQGTSPKHVQELLGHSHISITLGIYSHALPGARDSVAAAMDDLLSS
jgi:integrase